MSYDRDVRRLTPLFSQAELDHRTYTAALASGRRDDPDLNALLTRLRMGTDLIETEAAAVCDGLEAGKPEAVDVALAFLAIRHRPFRSGYACARIARRLKRAAMDADQKQILRRILLDRLTWPWAHTPDLWRCYPAVKNEASDRSLRDLAKHPKAFISRRAKAVLARADAAPRRPR